MDPRENTNKLVDAAENGWVSWETLARECLAQMSDDGAGDVATALGLDDYEEDRG